MKNSKALGGDLSQLDKGGFSTGNPIDPWAPGYLKDLIQSLGNVSGFINREIKRLPQLRWQIIKQNLD